MNVQLNSVSATRKTLVVALEPAEVDTEHQAVIVEYTRQARLPGFRPGHAPAAMIAKRFAKDIAEEFKQKVIARAYRGGLEQHKLEVLNVVDVKEGEIAPGTAATVTVTLDVRPEFTLPDYVGLATSVEPTDISEAEVEGVVQALRADKADFAAVDRPAAKGDYVKLAYEGTFEGKPVAELAPDKQLYGKVPQTWEEVEGTQEGHLPGLGAQLSGVKSGDKKTIQIAFPADFAAIPALAGKSASYALEIQEVRERVLPPVDAEFFKAHQVADLAGLKEQITRNLKIQKEYRNQAAQRRQVTEAIAAKADFPVPESMVDAETQGVLRNFIEENMRRGVPAEQFEKDKKGLFASARESAQKRVKLQLILARIAETEKIEVTDRDLDNFIHREAIRANQRPEKLAKELGRERSRLRAAQESILFDKAVDFLVSKAKMSVAPAKAT